METAREWKKGERKRGRKGEERKGKGCSVVVFILIPGRRYQGLPLPEGVYTDALWNMARSLRGK